MNITLALDTGSYLSEAAKLGYRKGQSAVIKKNKEKILGFQDTRDLFKIDYTTEDLAAIHNFRVEAFSVANVGSYELEEKLKDLALDVWQNHGQDFKLFEKQARDLMMQYIPVEDIPPSGWLKTNLNTAINSSYSAAQWNRLQDPAVRDIYPAYKYMTRNDSRVRDSHRILHEKVFRKDDPIWSEIWPPNGWNCRCYTIALSGDEIGEPEPMLRSEEMQKILTKNVNKDFRRNAGQIKSIWGKWLQSQLKDKKHDVIADRLKEYANNMPDGKDVVDKLNENPAKFRELQYSKGNWQKEFPSNGTETPLGWIELGKDQFDKLLRENRLQYFGLIKPTLTDPDYIIVDERNGTLFIKSFTKDRIYYFQSVLKNKDGLEVIVGSGERKDKQIIDRVNKGKLLIYSRAFRRSAGTDGGSSKFADDASRLDFANINKSDSKENPRIKDYADFELILGIDKSAALRNVLQEPDEVWAETYNRDGKVNSDMNYIRYGIDGFELAKVNNAEVYEFKNADYSHLDDSRIGVLIYKK